MALVTADISVSLDGFAAGPTSAFCALELEQVSARQTELVTHLVNRPAR